MYTVRRINYKLAPRNRLLGIYITLIHDLNPNVKYTYQEIKDKLKIDFDYDASLDDISNYYEPNFYEERLDLEQQMKNLQIRYD